jgi:ketosteroid isomerase-like protein
MARLDRATQQGRVSVPMTLFSRADACSLGGPIESGHDIWGGMEKMRSATLLVSLLATIATPAFADDRALITQYEQQLSDAVTNGQPAVWDKYLDPQVIFAEENDTYKGKDAMVKEVVPLPKGLGGDIKVELLSFHEEGDTAVALFRQHEIEHYYGQDIHASYLLNTTWQKRADGWKMIAAGTLAERTDPPSITLPASDFSKFAGTYKLRNSAPTYTLAVTNGQLMGARNGKMPSQWKAETRDVFFIPGDNRIRKIFQYDASGKVTGFLERRESWDIFWDKVS